jgi:1,4-alpha-glucan branching enzyme
VATGLVLTAPGIPMLFMGQEFLENKQWSDNPSFDRGTLIWWEGLDQGVKKMVDHLRFTRELIALRKRQPALRSDAINVFHVHNVNRVIAFHRWTGVGRDVVIVANLREQTWYGYRIGLPRPGRWLEVFNSDVYENWVNPIVAGNGDGVDAEFFGAHGLGFSAPIVIPANGFVILAQDRGDQ